MQTEAASLGSWKRFGLDVAASRRAIHSAPAVPLVSGALVAMGFLVVTGSSRYGIPTLQLLYVPLLIIWCGWVGVERIFFLSRFRGEKLKLLQAPALALRFIPRFLLLFVIPLVPFVILLSFQSMSFTTSTIGSETPFLFGSLWFSIVQLLLVLALIVLITFVTPALAFTTKNTLRGLEIGVRFLRDRWRQGKVYALLPILIWGFVSPLSATGYSFGIPVQLAATLVWVYLILLLKGAAARFYLAEIKHDIPSEGAAFVTAEDVAIAPADRAAVQAFGWLKYLGLGLLVVGFGIALFWPVTVEIRETFENGGVAALARCGGPVRTLVFGPRSDQPGFFQFLDGTQSIEIYRRVRAECARRALTPLIMGVATAAVGIGFYLLVRRRGKQ